MSWWQPSTSQNKRRGQGFVMNASATVDSLEYILPPIGAFIFFGYMATFFVVLCTHPLRLNLGIRMAIRRRWAAHVVEDNQAIIAVQTLRNTQNAAGVFASASVIVAFFAFQQGASLSGEGSTLQGFKFYCLGATLVGAFFVFGLCIREAEAIASEIGERKLILLGPGNTKLQDSRFTVQEAGVDHVVIKLLGEEHLIIPFSSITSLKVERQQLTITYR